MSLDKSIHNGIITTTKVINVIHHLQKLPCVPLFCFIVFFCFYVVTILNMRSEHEGTLNQFLSAQYYIINYRPMLSSGPLEFIQSAYLV